MQEALPLPKWSSALSPATTAKEVPAAAGLAANVIVTAVIAAAVVNLYAILAAYLAAFSEFKYPLDNPVVGRLHVIGLGTPITLILGGIAIVVLQSKRSWKSTLGWFAVGVGIMLIPVNYVVFFFGGIS